MEKLIEKYLGSNTPQWITDKCKLMLQEYVEKNPIIQEKEKTHILKDLLPSKDEIVNELYGRVYNGFYEKRNVMSDNMQDYYYSGYLDCYDMLVEKNIIQKHNHCEECGKELESGTVFCSQNCRMHYYN